MPVWSVWSQPAVGGIFYDADGKGATVELVPRAPYGMGSNPAIESYFYTTDNSWPQIGASGRPELPTSILVPPAVHACSLATTLTAGAPGTTVQATKFAPPNVLSNATIRVTRTAALNVRYKFVGMLESMTMTLVVPVPVQPVGY